MDSLLSRYRNLTVLLVLIAAQLVLLGYQVKSNQDVRLIRVWSVSAITPLARVLESMRMHTFSVFEDYFVLLGMREENRRLRDQVGKLKMQNQFLETQLSDADRARALAAFQAQTPSKTVAARVIANGTGSNSATVFIDRGSKSGVESGMAVVTPEGIVGKVISAYPVASLVLLVTDPTFAAGVISQKNHVGGTLKGQGHGNCTVDYIQNEQKVDPSEWFYTSGYDRVFPRGFPVGQVSVARSGRNGKEIYLNPSGLQGGVEEVLVVLDGVHQMIPENIPVFASMHLMPMPPDTAPSLVMDPATKELNTQADQIKDAYKKIGQAENHQYGITGNVPNFNVKLPGQQAEAKPPAPSPAGAQGAGTTPPTPGITASNAGVTTKPVQTFQTPAGLPGSPHPVAGAPPVAPPATLPQKTASTAPKKVDKPVAELPKKPKAPLLETDPTDADPAEPEVLRTIAKPKSPEQKPVAEKPQ